MPLLRRKVHQTLKRVTRDFEQFEFNTIIAALMSLTNKLYDYRAATEGSAAWNEGIETYLKLLAPIVNSTLPVGRSDALVSLDENIADRLQIAYAC